MREFISWGLRISLSAYAILHFVTYFWKAEMLIDWLAISGMLTFIFAGITLTLKRFKLPFFLVLLGFVIMLLTGSPIVDGLHQGMILMRNIIGLLVVIPMISWVLNEEPYIENIMRVSYRMINTSRKLYFGIISFTQIISYFLLFGSIPMMYEFINKMVGEQHGEAMENFKSTALLRSFALSTIWVVSIPSFIFAVETLGASLWIAIFQGLFISVCGIIVAVGFSYVEEKRYGVDLTAIIKNEMGEALRNATEAEQNNRKVVEFIFLFISLFGTIFLLHAVWPIDLMLIIPLVIIAWTLLYYAVKKRPAKLVKETGIFFKEGVTKQSYQLSLMLGAGMMIYSLNQTGFGEFVVGGVGFMQEHVPSVNLLYILPFIVILLGFTGLGPLTVMVLVAGILKNIALPYPPELIVMAITSGSVISILLSPLIMPVIILSSSNGLSGFKNGMKFNLAYAIVFYIIAQIYIQTMVQLW